MAPPALIADLVERFARHRDAYRSGLYNETQLRRESIGPAPRISAQPSQFRDLAAGFRE